MPCEEAMRREQEAFRKVAMAVGRRGRIDPSVAAYTEHWEGYEAAINELTAALTEYEAAAIALSEDRAEHMRGPVRTGSAPAE